MATIVEMRDITRQYERAYGRRRQHSGSATNATTSPVAIPVGVRQVSVGVVPGTDAVVEYTMSDYSTIEANTAVWHAWSAGTVTAKTAATVPESATAIRMTSTGSSTWNVTA